MKRKHLVISNSSKAINIVASDTNTIGYKKRTSTSTSDVGDR